MREIKPVHLGDKGSRVSNLHKGLLFLLLHQPGISDNDRQTLQQRLASDVRTETFGKATAEIVGMWQNQLKNWPDYLPALPKGLRLELQRLSISAATGRGNGDVDELTAKGLNWILRKFRALDPA